MPDQFSQGRTDARRYETGEANVAGRVGLSVALQAARTTGVDVIARELAAIADTLRRRIRELPGADRRGGAGLAGFVTVAGLDVASTVAELARHGIAVSSPARTFAPLDMDARGLASVIRIAPHTFTTADDIDALIGVLENVATNKPS